MFETAEVIQKIGKAAYEEQVPALRAALLAAQRELAASNLGVIVLVGGVEGAGKTSTVNLLHEWLDARGIETHAMGEPSDEERMRPPMWRFWRVLPPRGRMAIFLGSWYTQPVIERVFGRMGGASFQARLDRMVAFEELLGREGYLVVKFWLHLSRKAQKRRLEALERDPLQKWRVRPIDWKYFKRYDRFREVSEVAIRRTSTGAAPWHIIAAADENFRNLSVAKVLLQALTDGLAAAGHAAPKPQPDRPKPPAASIIRALDLSRHADGKGYDERLLRCQGQFNRLTRRLHEEGRQLILVFEGPDAAGKGGTIRRLTQAMDARNYQVISIAAPTDEERARPYLWRFWRHLPRQGRVTIYDRSWYGRVLVERLEGFCSRADWQRAYGEINAFEEELTDFGIIVVKFWLAISPEEQLRRFEDRQVTPYKQYKITEEDWRNRAKWNAYEAAAVDMIERTSTTRAPWVLVEAEDKRCARLKVLKAAIRHIRRELDR
ncbi:MAG: polyphosphate:AMP phosphotransferase [Acidobacteria bacterium]|nr:polyphosphate:AMP phosphotransferase [Acidobacteriota bacterium]